MKTLALLLALCVSAVAQSGEYSSEYDRFTKTNWVHYKTYVPGHTMVLLAEINDNPRKRSVVTIAFHPNVNKVYRFQTLRLLIDGKPMELTDNDIDPIALFELTRPQLKAITKAKIVEFQLNNAFEGVFDKGTMRAFRNLTTLLPPR